MPHTSIIDALLGQLKKVKGPDLESNIVDLGLVSNIHFENGKASLSLSVPAERAAALEPMRAAAEKVILELDTVEVALVVLTAEKATSHQQRDVSPPIAVKVKPSTKEKQRGLPSSIQSIIAVASGKGGVGKSTTSVNLALAMQALGLKVGILDADIYGPSLPRLLGIAGRPQPAGGQIIMPLEGFGIKVISMGFLVDEETPMVWRGPMVVSAITQMLRQVEWGELDLLIVDMPPGTGDVQLTLAQEVPLAGAIIVATPQDLALIDARKGLNMFRQVDVPVLGFIENMSFYICPKCGDRHEIFGHGGAEKEAERIGVPFLGRVPLDIAIRTNADLGTPIVVSAPKSEHSKVYHLLAENILKRMNQGKKLSAKPKIIIE